MKFRLVCAAVASAGVLSACTGVHPGAAVILNSHKIALSDVDVATRGFCAVSLASSTSGSVPTVADSRLQALQQLVIAELAEQVATQRGIKVKPEELTDDDVANIVKNFGKRADDVVATSELLASVTPIVRAIGEADTGLKADPAQPQSEVTTKVMNAGYAVVEAALHDAKITINPELGITSIDDSEISSGSLSVLGNSTPITPSAALSCS